MDKDTVDHAFILLPVLVNSGNPAFMLKLDGKRLADRIPVRKESLGRRFRYQGIAFLGEILPAPFHEGDAEDIQHGGFRPRVTDAIGGDIFPGPILHLHKAYLVISRHDKVVAGLCNVRGTVRHHLNQGPEYLRAI